MITPINFGNLAMTPDKQQILNQHIRAIAEILYEDTPKEQLTTLSGIEQAVRQQMLTQVMPQVGVFLSNPAPTPRWDELASSKVF